MNSTQTSVTDEQTSELEQVATKTYSQQEVDDMMARMKGSITKKILKPYEDLGDPDYLRQLKIAAEETQREQQLKRGEFEKTLQEIVTKKDAEITKRDQMIKEYKVNTPLINAAAKYKAVNVEQVKTLLSNKLSLNEHGEVEVLDDKGTVRYSDSGSLLGVDDLVREFLDSNPHFVSASPSTTHSKSNTGTFSAEEFDLSSLDLSKPADRQKYAQARANGLI